VIGIIAATAIILQPVISGARVAAKKTVSASNLHQIHVQTALYQTNWDGDGKYGACEDMGLPRPEDRNTALPLFLALRPPALPHPSSMRIGSTYYTFWASRDQDAVRLTWLDYSQQAGGSSILAIDPFFNSPSLPISDGEYIKRFLLAVNLDGTLVRKIGYGDWELRQWWLGK